MKDEPGPMLATHYRALAVDAYTAAQRLEDPGERLIMHQIALG